MRHDRLPLAQAAYLFAVGIVLAMPLSGCTAPPEAGHAAAAEAIRDVLDEQVAAWNRGDIPAFMSGYAETDTLRFASGGTVQRGWQQTLDRYRASYADESVMGTLSFSELEIWPRSDRHAVVFGRWALARSPEIGDAGGLFTLIFEQTPDGWKIVHDHTSSGPAPPSQQEVPVDTTSQDVEP